MMKVKTDKNEIRKGKFQRNEKLPSARSLAEIRENAGMNKNVVRQTQTGISSSTLKMIAMLSMLTDHVAYVLLGPFLTVEGIYPVYQFLRGVIGRLAFPVYCFLLVEGFERTKNKGKYAGRLFVFALLSEIPFDLAFYGHPFEGKGQNVFFTLLLGLFTMWGISLLEERGRNVRLLWIMKVMPVLAACMIAGLIGCDYGAKGIFAIVLLYVFRKNKIQQIVAGCVAFWWEYTAALAFIPVAFYRGKKGLNIKYFFYAFYPLHLLALYGIQKLLI